MATDETMTPKEAGARLRLGLAAIYGLIDSGEIPSRRVGPKRRKILLDVADVEAYWAASKVGAKAEPIKGTSRYLRPPSRARRPA